MDIDTTEIQVWTRQADGSHQMRWVPLRELMKLMEQEARERHAERAKALGEALARSAQTPPERS